MEQEEEDTVIFIYDLSRIIIVNIYTYIYDIETLHSFNLYKYIFKIKNKTNQKKKKEKERIFMNYKQLFNKLKQLRTKEIERREIQIFIYIY